MITPTKTELIDLFWRSIWTFIQVTFGIITGDFLLNAFENNEPSVAPWRIVLYAGIGAVLSVIKTYASNKNGTGTATTVPVPKVGLQPVSGGVSKSAN